MEIVVRGIKGATVVDLHGRLDLNARWHFKAIMQQCCLTEEEHLIVNLAGLTHMDSAGLGFLVSAFLRFTGLNRRMTLVRPQGAVDAVFQHLQLQDMIPVVAHEREALDRPES